MKKILLTCGLLALVATGCNPGQSTLSSPTTPAANATAEVTNSNTISAKTPQTPTVPAPANSTNTNQPSPSPSNTPILSTGVMIISPNKADQEWKLGTSHDIKWQNMGDKSTTGIKISLISFKGSYCTNSVPPNCSGSESYVIEASAPNSGTYHWNIPNDLPAGFIGGGGIGIAIEPLAGTKVQETYSASILIKK